MNWSGRIWLLFILGGAVILVVGYDLGLTVQSDWPSDAAGQWTAIEAIATMGTLVASSFAFVAVVFAYGTLKTGELEHRLHTLPYFKVYVGFECLRPSSFVPPQADLALKLTDVKADKETKELFGDLHSEEDDAHPLSVWIRNLQDAHLGVGFDITLALGMRWQMKGKKEIRETGFELGYHHVEAGNTVKIHLSSIGAEVDYVDVTVLGIRYYDINARPFSGGHGPAVFRYDREGEVLNEPINF